MFHQKMEKIMKELDDDMFNFKVKLVKKKVLEMIDVNEASYEEIEDAVKEAVNEITETFSFKYVLAEEGIELVKNRVFN